MTSESDTSPPPDGSPTGLILHLEKMALFDGEGLRTVVFLKGCPLRCQWCSTPESQSPAPQLGYDPLRCTGCQSCVTVCPQQAIRPTADGQGVVTDPAACRQCFECVPVCPSKARKAFGRRVSAARIVEEVEKDDIFFFHSGGGLTISGGEPLMQADFARAVLAECRRRGLHTAIETSGQASWDQFAKLLPFLDTVIIDVKALDPRRHKALTGQDNALILENIRRLDTAETALDLVIRIPLIPGLNDDPDNLQATGRFCQELRKFRELHLLPYHRLGVESYRLLGRSYALEGLASPDPTAVETAAEILRQMGLPVKIGG
jgi:pyruvate formate lyase activating enzyme